MKKSYFMLFFLLSTVILLGACGTKESSSKPTSSTEMIVGKNAPKPLDKPLSIKIGYPTQGASMLSLWVAKDLGIFEKYGVNAELIYVAGTPKVQETLNSGGIEVGLAGADSVGKAKVAGIETVILSAVADRSAMYVYGQKDVDQSNIANELKGTLTPVIALNLQKKYFA